MKPSPAVLRSSYQGGAIGSFNSWMRLLTGALIEMQFDLLSKSCIPLAVQLRANSKIGKLFLLNSL